MSDPELWMSMHCFTEKSSEEESAAAPKERASSAASQSAEVACGRLPPPAVGRRLKCSDLPLTARKPAIINRSIFRLMNTGDSLFRINEGKAIHFKGCRLLVEAYENKSGGRISVLGSCLGCARVVHCGHQRKVAALAPVYL